MTHGADALYQEMSYIAYHFHWSFDELLDLEHPVRQRFVSEINRLQEPPRNRGNNSRAGW